MLWSFGSSVVKEVVSLVVVVARGVEVAEVTVVGVMIVEVAEVIVVGVEMIEVVVEGVEVMVFLVLLLFMAVGRSSIYIVS